MNSYHTCLLGLAILLAIHVYAQENPPPPSPQTNPLLSQIAVIAPAERIETDIRTLVSFGTRHTV